MQSIDTDRRAKSLEASVGDVIGCAWSGVSCLVMAWLFWMAWWRPLELDEGRWVKLGVGVMVLEFILVHSGGVLHHLMQEKAGWGRTKMVLGLTALYTLFGVGIALGFKSWWLFGSYVLVMSGRLWALAIGKWTAMDEAVSQRRMVVSVCLYLGLIFATLFLPIPRGGITPSLSSSVWDSGDEGAWVDNPEKAIAMGFFYFLLLGLAEIRPPQRLWNTTRRNGG